MIGKYSIINKKSKIGSGALIRSHTVIYEGVVIGKNFHTGHGALIREGTRIGDDVSVGSGSIIEHHVTIGDGVRIHSNAFVPEYTVIEAGAWIGPCAVLTNSRYPNSPRAKSKLEAPRLGKGCIIGANATILPGVKIGARAVVGAGSVVTRDVPAGAVVAGNPARKLKDVGKIKDYGSS